MEREGEAFNLKAAQRTQDAGTRRLLGDLARAEAGRRGQAGALAASHLDYAVLNDENASSC